MSTKEKPCKIIGGIAGLLGLIAVIISCLFLAKIVGCDDEDDGKGQVKQGPIGFKPHDEKLQPAGFGFNKFPYGAGGGPGKKNRFERDLNDIPQLQLPKISKNYKYYNNKKSGDGGGEFTTFYACAICGIIFGLVQIIFSGLFCSYVNAKNCKKMANIWCVVHALLIIAYIGIFIAMLTFDWEKYALYFYLHDYFTCFKFNKAFIGLIGLDWILLLILLCLACWCSKKSNPPDDDEQQRCEDEKVQFSKKSKNKQ